MISRETIKEFFNYLKLNKFRQFNYFAVFFLFCLLPSQSYNPDLSIIPKQPIIRFLDFDLPEVSQYPLNFTGRGAPQLTAFSSLAIDFSSKTIIYAKNPDYQLLPASTTKIMTALVSLDYYSLSEVIKVERVNGIGQTMELEKDEEISIENLLYGLLVQSGNDAAYALAESYPGGVQKFVSSMNVKARSLHLDNTHFVNPAGIDAAGQFSTVHDLAVLTAEALKNPTIHKIVSIEEIEVADTSGEIIHELVNINQLLGKVAGLKGVKTGWTESAGECLVAYTEREGRAIITVVLASEDRFGETEKLIEWVYNNFQWESL